MDEKEINEIMDFGELLNEDITAYEKPTKSKEIG